MRGEEHSWRTVSKGEAALGVGVVDAHGQALVRADDVIRLVGILADSVLRHRQHAHCTLAQDIRVRKFSMAPTKSTLLKLKAQTRTDVSRDTQLSHRHHRGESRGRPAHVEVHVLHATRRLDVETARVVRDALGVRKIKT